MGSNTLHLNAGSINPLPDSKAGGTSSSGTAPTCKTLGAASSMEKPTASGGCNLEPFLPRLLETFIPKEQDPALAMPPAAEHMPWRWLAAARASRRLVLVVVFVALLLDNMLLTVVVPIVPTFLYATEYEGANSSTAPAQTETAPPALKAPPFSSVFSYFDNTTVTVLVSTSATELVNGTESSIPPEPTASIPPSPSSCPDGEEFLAKENTRVGLLFASKALVQLMVNPAVGVLTNRIGYHIPMFIGFVTMFLSTVSEYCPSVCPSHPAAQEGTHCSVPMQGKGVRAEQLAPETGGKKGQASLCPLQHPNQCKLRPLLQGFNAHSTALPDPCLPFLCSVCLLRHLHPAAHRPSAPRHRVIVLISRRYKF
uniref:Uncharacterized protein n=1 Tax=Melopsittacus undulatus TaxID=13146 RepID=A0A8V5H0G6_MELUD